MISVSACVLSYNRPFYLRSAIESILEQTMPPSEILVFDNGSDINVRAQMEAYITRGDIKWYGSERNYTTAWNFNRAIENSNCEYILVLHDDDRICPNYLESQIEFLNKNPNVIAVTCNGHIIDESGKRTGRKLRNNYSISNVDYYKSSVAVAMCYANDSCLPMSPFLYKTRFIKGFYPKEKEYGKVGDAVLLCELVKKGDLAFQYEPYYECRIHKGQDSQFFFFDDLERLNQYFKNLRDGSARERKLLLKQLTRQHTWRRLYIIYTNIYPKIKIKNLLIELVEIFDQRFSFIDALKITFRALGIRTLRLVKNFLIISDQSNK
jgi:glycosyltransferase involved in cell wall biosynthesis